VGVVVVSVEVQLGGRGGRTKVTRMLVWSVPSFVVASFVIGTKDVLLSIC